MRRSQPCQVRSTSSAGPATVEISAKGRRTPYALVSEFGTAEDFNTYLEHPAHQAVTRDHLLPLAESWHSVQVVGYDD
jgi:heme-degrading monooxygenase HmoA